MNESEIFLNIFIATKSTVTYRKVSKLVLSIATSEIACKEYCLYILCFTFWWCRSENFRPLPTICCCYPPSYDWIKITTTIYCTLKSLSKATWFHFCVVCYLFTSNASFSSKSTAIAHAQNNFTSILLRHGLLVRAATRDESRAFSREKSTILFIFNGQKQ